MTNAGRPAFDPRALGRSYDAQAWKADVRAHAGAGTWSSLTRFATVVPRG